MGWGLGRVMFGLEASEIGMGLKKYGLGLANLVERKTHLSWGLEVSFLVLRHPKSGLVVRNMASACS